ncbi:helix-turn-helix domain-containing protein [Micromonospora echinospora]
MTTSTLPKLHPFPVVAERLGISLRTLREQSWAKRFDHVRIGRERYLTDEQLAAFIRANTVTSATTSQREEALAASGGRRRSSKTK